MYVECCDGSTWSCSKGYRAGAYLLEGCYMDVWVMRYIGYYVLQKDRQLSLVESKKYLKYCNVIHVYEPCANAIHRSYRTPGYFAPHNASQNIVSTPFTVTALTLAEQPIILSVYASQIVKLGFVPFLNHLWIVRHV
jgi:hypothetical protein